MTHNIYQKLYTRYSQNGHWTERDIDHNTQDIHMIMMEESNSEEMEEK